MLDILTRYDILGAFWMTIQLSFWAALGSLALGTILAIMRVSPVAVLQKLGALYVNVARNTPLTLILVFCVLGAFYILQLSLAPASAPLRTQIFLWAIVGLSLYHAAFVCEALRSGVNTVPVGQAEAARAIGLTFTQSLSQVILPQAFRGAIAPLGSVLIALIKNTTVASIIGSQEASAMMKTIVENETGSLLVFFIFALGFVILTLPIGVGFTEMSRRLAVKR
ncbi:amino acid ABC transporter permease [Propioniciclava sinopodophylli]|jgi:glutamate transport system permease protein|uniref:Amino acid ABC transporter permease n=1 Tax=Propioniciclava sinopodophylli TaxID=1837344 RepID=A0A4Q9KHF3_9ACTN|nr:amino acid ABC transporter permease [Propioniciclava sinopodophylli]TBT88765.1 amino acid ABC transporter permease [Propioniciclava sinopodophylli]